MKNVIVLLYLAIPFAFIAQTDEAAKRYEDSLFQHQTLGVNLLVTRFYAEEHAWLDKEFTPIYEALTNVSGVYTVELSDYDRVLKVTHSARLTFDDLKPYIIPFKLDFAVHRSEEYLPK